MSDQALLSFGAAATFIAASGIYIYIRALINDPSTDNRDNVAVRVVVGRDNRNRRPPSDRAA